MKVYKYIITLLLLATTAMPLLAVTHYVDINSTNPVSPYTNWVTAATNIQDAVDAASDGDTVLVTNGVYDTGEAITPGYSLMNRLVVTNSVTIESVNGPSNTFIVGSEATGGGNGADAIRCVYMTSGILSGFTLTNGHTQTAGDWSKDQSGGGTHASGGTLTNCTIVGNSAIAAGGGTCFGTINNCTIVGNLASSGGGTYEGTINNCTITANSASNYGGGAHYGTINNCTITANSAATGGGTYYSTINNSTITSNSAFTGGGAYGSTINNCTITANSASWGGGTSEGTINNCTITANSADQRGGGTFNGRINNCIVYYNTSRFFANDYYGGSYSFSCTTPYPGGTGNITNAPMLLSARHIHATSLCVGAGSSNYVSGADIDGDPWQNPPSMGCDEPMPPYFGTLNVEITADYTNAAVGFVFPFVGNVEGTPSSNMWMFGDGTSVSNRIYAEHWWSSTGDYDVVLTAYNTDNPGGVSATVVVHVVETPIYYVNISNATPMAPYTNWATAATKIQDAVDEVVIPGSKVIVTDGVYSAGSRITPGYSLMNRLVVTNSVTIESVNGPSYTFIVGAEATGGGNGADAIRCVYMTSGILSGFTLTNGHTQTVGDWNEDQSGGGTHASGGTLTNCTIVGNSADYGGGGTSYGTVNNCTIVGNSGNLYGGGTCFSTINNCTITANSAATGGGTYYSTINNSTITSNSAFTGGGAYGSTINNCTITANSASTYGGGTYQGRIYNCTISGNSADSGGGGTIYGTINSCTIVDNSTLWFGGGTYNGTINNCTISGNSAQWYGGGTYNGTINNCTISGNSADQGGGTYFGTINNCIIYYNAASLGSNYNSSSSYSYSCTSPDPGGIGNITNEPTFISSNDYHLALGSPCINVGNNVYASETTDLDGNPRIIAGVVDMGAYEFDPPTATITGTISYNGNQTGIIYVVADATSVTTNYTAVLGAQGPYIISNVTLSTYLPQDQPAEDTVLLYGKAFWVINNQTTDQEVVVMGEVPGWSYVDIPVYAGTNWLGSPYTIDTTWDETELAQDSPVGSSLYLWDPTNAVYESYTKTIAGWTPSNALIKLGQGFIYIQPNGTVTNWHVPLPYTNVFSPPWPPYPYDGSGGAGNIVGYYTIDVPAQGKALGTISLVPLSSGLPATVSNVFGAQLTGAAVPSEADQLEFYDEQSGSYIRLWKHETRGWLTLSEYYDVSAFMDLNSNGVQELWEPAGSYSNNPIYVINDMTGIDVFLEDFLYTVTATAGTNGSIVPSGAVRVAHGSSANLVITPDQNYHVLDVLVNGGSIGPTNAYTFANVTNNQTIHANFAIDTFTLTVSTPYGTALPAGVTTSDWNTLITASVIDSPVAPGPGTQHVCVGWTGSGSVPISGNTTSVTFTITNDSTITWNWQTQYQLTLSATNGTISGVSGGWKNAGFVYDLLPSPNPGWFLDHWEVNGTDVGGSVPLSVTMNGPMSVVAVFVPTLIIDVTGFIEASFPVWELNLQTGTYFGALRLENRIQSGMTLKNRFWYAVMPTAQYRLMNPTGTLPDGKDYIDITARVLTALPGVGNGDQILDPGEFVLIEGIEFYSSDLSYPTGYDYAVWAEVSRAIPDMNAVDTDGDGMANGWEDSFGLNRNNPGDRDEDSDGDGSSNIEEYIAGTSPTNDTSVFKITGMSKVTTNDLITWDTVAGKNYTVQTTTNLMSTWTNVSDPMYTNIMGSGAPLSYTNADSADSQRFFRVKVR